MGDYKVVDLKNKNIEFIFAIPLGNHHGHVDVFKIDDEYYLTLDDHISGNGVLISKEIANMFKKFLYNNKEIKLIELPKGEFFLDIKEQIQRVD